LRIAVLRVLDSAVTAGRRSVGEPHFSVVLAFFNVALALLLIAVVISVGFCVVVNPEAAAARAVDDAVKTAFWSLSAAACVSSAAQLVPGPQAWRQLRQRAGVVNLCIIWPAVIAVGTVGYLQLPGCP
jgi:O-antigen/teichoic acid export membrane protein